MDDVILRCGDSGGSLEHEFGIAIRLRKLKGEIVIRCRKVVLWMKEVLDGILF